MDKEEEYLNNPFSLTLMESFSKSTKNFQYREGFEFGKNNHHLLSNVEKFQANVSQIQGNLGNIATQLDMIKIFISRYPYKKHYFQNGITQLDYIQYHTDCFVHKIHTVLEIMKLLVNEVYRLNIPKKDCNWYALSKHLGNDALPMKCINAYFKGFENFIDLRHLSSHRGIYNDSAKDKIEIDNAYFLYRYQGKNGYEINEDIKQAFPLVYLEYQIKEYKKKRVKLLDQSIKAHKFLLRQFLSSLYPEYLKQVTKLS